MTDPPKLELVPDEDDGEPPPTTLQRAVRETLAVQLAPVINAWDERSRDMLDVLAEASDTKHEVRRAARTIKIAGWIGAAGVMAICFMIWQVLEHERIDRRLFREQEQTRRLEAAQMVIEAGREDLRRATQLVRESCPNR